MSHPLDPDAEVLLSVADMRQADGLAIATGTPASN